MVFNESGPQVENGRDDFEAFVPSEIRQAIIGSPGGLETRMPLINWAIAVGKWSERSHEIGRDLQDRIIHQDREDYNDEINGWIEKIATLREKAESLPENLGTREAIVAIENWYSSIARE